MTEDQKKNRAFIVTILGAVSFGFWQHSWMAGIFMFTFLLFFGGLVVAIQHCVVKAIEQLNSGTCPNCQDKL